MSTTLILVSDLKVGDRFIHSSDIDKPRTSDKVLFMDGKKPFMKNEYIVNCHCYDNKAKRVFVMRKTDKVLLVK